MIIEEAGISLLSVEKFTNPRNKFSPLRYALKFQDFKFAQFLIDNNAPMRDRIGLGYMLNTVLANGRSIGEVFNSGAFLRGYR